MDEIQIETPQQDTLQEVPITEISSSGDAAKNQANGPSCDSLKHSHDIPVEFVANFNTIKSVFSETSSKLNQEQVQKQLTQVFLDSCEIHSFAHEYDFSPSVKYNGFRTFFKIISEYLDQLSLLVRLLKSGIAAKKQKKLVNRINKYVSVLPLLAHQLHSLKLVRKQKFVKDEEEDSDSNKKDEYPKEVKEVERLDKTVPLELEILFHQMKLTEKDMEPFFEDTLYGFWLPNSIRTIFKATTAFTISFIFYPWYKGIFSYFSKKKIATLSADRAINSSAAEVKKEQQFLNWIISSKPPPDATVSEFIIPPERKQHRFFIDKKSLLFEHYLNSPCRHGRIEPIRLVIVKPKCRRNDNVIFHIHGGGWCLLSPEGYFNVMNRWVKEIGSTIVSIDYPLAPDHKYPVALQQCLDAYSWLVDLKFLKQSEPLGFVPKDFLVTGDSAGGNLTMALAIVLAEIKRVFPDEGQAIPFPKAFAPLYPAASPGLPYTTASSTIFDVVISMSLRTTFCLLYYLDDPIDSTSYLGGKNGKPWFKEEAKMKDLYLRLNGDKKGDPIFHVFTYESFDILKDVPLYIQAAEFDPLLDDAVEIAKAWKGPVTFDVLPNVIHGFTIFCEKSDECQKADKLVTQRMKEALEN